MMAEREIRTLEGLLDLTPLAGVRLRPFGHLSAAKRIFCFSELPLEVLFNAPRESIPRAFSDLCHSDYLPASPTSY